MSYTNLIYHVVFGTKHRTPFIHADIRPALHKYLGGTLRGLGCICLEIGGGGDHVHILVEIPPTKRVADILRDLKSNSSTWAKRNGIHDFAWQRRYGAFTVSESQIAKISTYIRNQETHHQKFDFKYEFEKMLKSNGIEIDGYVWQE